MEKTIERIAERITVNSINGEASVYTGWPLLRQLNAMGAKIKLTANDPYPTFIADYGNHIWMFNAAGGPVDTMCGTFFATPFDCVKDIRDELPYLKWKEGWD